MIENGGTAYTKCNKCGTNMIAKKRGYKKGELISAIVLLFIPFWIITIPLAVIFYLMATVGKNDTVFTCPACANVQRREVIQPVTSNNIKKETPEELKANANFVGWFFLVIGIIAIGAYVLSQINF